MKLKALTAIILTTVSLSVSAQSEIVDSLASATSITEAINSPSSSMQVLQPREVAALVQKKEGAAHSQLSAGPLRKAGYRVQVFSDNNLSTAKSNAEYRKRLVEQEMPHLRAYLTFDSPYWRVRVGDFRNQYDADAVMRQLKSAFPAFADDFRIVRERINTAQ